MCQTQLFTFFLPKNEACMNMTSLHLQHCKKLWRGLRTVAGPAIMDMGRRTIFRSVSRIALFKRTAAFPICRALCNPLNKEQMSMDAGCRPSTIKKRQLCLSENDLLQNQKDDHDEDQNDKDSGTHHHAPFLLCPLSLQNRRTKILDCKLQILMLPTIFLYFFISRNAMIIRFCK